MLWVWVLPIQSYALDDPELDYFTLETPHFYVHYHSGLDDLHRGRSPLRSVRDFGPSLFMGTCFENACRCNR